MTGALCLKTERPSSLLLQVRAVDIASGLTSRQVQHKLARSKVGLGHDRRERLDAGLDLAAKPLPDPRTRCLVLAFHAIGRSSARKNNWQASAGDTPASISSSPAWNDQPAKRHSFLTSPISQTRLSASAPRM